MLAYNLPPKLKPQRQIEVIHSMQKAQSFKDLRILTVNLAAFLAKGRHLWAKSQVKEPVSAIVVRFNAVLKYKRSKFFDCKDTTARKTVTQAIR